MAPNELRADRPLAGDRIPATPTAGGPPKSPPRPPAPKRRRQNPFGFFGWMWRIGVILAGTVVVGGGVAAFGFYRAAVAELPDIQWLTTYEPPQMSRIYAANSELMAELATERRVFVPIAAIPRLVQQAFVSAEDQNFWTHSGVDPVAIARAAITNVENLSTGRRAVGASTITQQVAKNMLTGNDRTMLRKLREAILASRIETAMPKSRILEIYLNEIFLGAQAYCVAAAAQQYFSKGLDDLTVAEAAFLAALPKAPNNYNPLRYPDAARARRAWVIDRMLDDQAITVAQATTAHAEPLQARPSRRPDFVSVGQYFTEEVRRELVARFGTEQTTMGGLVARTSLDPTLQANAEEALRKGLFSYDRRRGGWRGPVARISAASTDWLPQLEQVARPPGALSGWHLAVALEVKNSEARMAWIERADPRAAAEPRSMTLPLDDVQPWAKPVQPGGRLGGSPRRMQDVLSPGDVVLVEVEPATPAAGRTRASPEHLSLRQLPNVEGAVVALDPNTGRVLAMVGGFSFERSWFNRASQAQRQPGSSFKPFVYLPALELGIPPNQRLLDAPIEIATPQGMWRPGNYAGTSNGWVTMRSAIERSLNLVTVRLAQEIGIDRVAATAARFGVIDNMPRYLAMALGSGETTVLRMAAGYASFANGGKRVEPTLIDSVQDRFGRLVWRPEGRACPECATRPFQDGPPELTDTRRQITDPIAAYQMTSLLQGVVQHGTGGRAGAGLNRPIAGKTGTTNDYVDNWFVGYTPDLVVAVWMGFDDPQSLGNGETGGGNAAPIFHDVVEAALGDSPPVPFRVPPGVALVRIQNDRGQTFTEAFRPGTENSARPPPNDTDLFGGTANGGVPDLPPAFGVPGVQGTPGAAQRRLGDLY